MALLTQRAWRNLGVGLIAFVAGGAAWGQLLELKPSNIEGAKAGGSQIQQSISFTCYDFFTASRVNCHVTATLRPIDPNDTKPPLFGGHNHSPILDSRVVGSVQNANNPSAPVGLQTEGDTLTGFTLVYTAPEASQQVQFVTKWEPPQNYECQNENEDTLGDFTSPCFGFNHFDIRFLGLQALPPDPLYTVDRKPDTAPLHPNGNFGTRAANFGLAQMAPIYFLAALVKLSINDQSLPRGGLFDINGNWAITPGHQRHRVGINADINQLGVPCLQDSALALSVALVGARRTCEPSGNKHITFIR
jgi:hypothetical protein